MDEEIETFYAIDSVIFNPRSEKNYMLDTPWKNEVRDMEKGPSSFNGFLIEVVVCSFYKDKDGMNR